MLFRVNFFCLFLLFLLFLSVGRSAKILGIFTTPSKSHLIVDLAVVRGLAEKGHDVTIITTLPIPDKNPKFRHISIDIVDSPQDIVRNIVKHPSKFSILQMLQVMSKMLEYMEISSQKIIQLPVMQESFDLVLLGYVFNEYQLGFAAHFKCPSVIIWMNQPIIDINSIVGNPNEISYVPLIFANLAQPMDFTGRVKNFGMFILETTANAVSKYQMSQFYNRLFPADKYPSFDEVRRNVSLVLTNHHFSQTPIRPNVPGLVEIGGIQIKPKPDPLAKNLQTALDNAKDGAIFFSLGTNVHSADLHPETFIKILRVLSKLKQTVIMKLEAEKLPIQAKNIIYDKWLPQDDILAHPNTKLFITHGGLGSIAEAKFHATPVIGLPIFGNQFSNLETVELEGWGIVLSLVQISEDGLNRAISEIFKNPKYSEKVKHLSDLYRDRLTSPLETATYWIEYVIRHKGAPHLQSPAIHMNFLQYYSLDVLAVYLIFLYIICKLLKLILRSIFRFLKKYQGKAKEKLKTE